MKHQVGEFMRAQLLKSVNALAFCLVDTKVVLSQYRCEQGIMAPGQIAG